MGLKEKKLYLWTLIIRRDLDTYGSNITYTSASGTDISLIVFVKNIQIF